MQDSLLGDALGLPEIEYLRRLTIGARLAWIATLGWWAPVVAMLLRAGTTERITIIAAVTLYLASRLVGVARWWLLTGPRPNEIAALRTAFLRWRVRVWKVIALGIVVGAVATAFDQIAANIYGLLHWWLALVWVLAVAASIWDGARVIEHLMGRLGASDMAPNVSAWRSSLVMWMLIFVIGGIVTQGCLMIPALIAVPFAWAWYAGTLLRLDAYLRFGLRGLEYRLGEAGRES